MVSRHDYSGTIIFAESTTLINQDKRLKLREWNAIYAKKEAIIEYNKNEAKGMAQQYEMYMWRRDSNIDNVRCFSIFYMLFF